jgi:hypothetical protein
MESCGNPMDMLGNPMGSLKGIPMEILRKS